jgi:carbonic anhydrase
MPGTVPAAAHGAPAAAAAPAHGTPTAAHAAPAPAARKVPAHSRDSESREKVVARVMKERGLAAPAALKPIEVAGHEEAHWDYEGENAPYRWGDMKPEFAACKSGQRQSPIDIRNPVMAQLDPIVFHYEDSPLKVLNNGHTIQVEFAPGSFILHGGSRYELIQMHFHTPSEERINGRPFDMVAHLVHKNAQGRLAVIAVLLGEGKAHPAIETIWNTMPGTAGRTRERADIAFNPMAMLPADRGFYSFQGSLTTPPCSEGVQWLVLKTPVEMGREQIVHFGALYPMNARPIQPTNDRVIKVGG